MAMMFAVIHAIYRRVCKIFQKNIIWPIFNFWLRAIKIIHRKVVDTSLVFAWITCWKSWLTIMTTSQLIIRCVLFMPHAKTNEMCVLVQVSCYQIVFDWAEIILGWCRVSFVWTAWQFYRGISDYQLLTCFSLSRAHRKSHNMIFKE